MTTSKILHRKARDPQKMSLSAEVIEFQVYQERCAGCPNERQCHEECVTCEEYEAAVAEAIAKEIPQY